MISILELPLLFYILLLVMSVSDEEARQDLHEASASTLFHFQAAERVICKQCKRARSKSRSCCVSIMHAFFSPHFSALAIPVGSRESWKHGAPLAALHVEQSINNRVGM